MVFILNGKCSEQNIDFFYLLKNYSRFLIYNDFSKYFCGSFILSSISNS